MHIFPDLKRLEEKYRDVLVVVGVHSAKFTAEGKTQGIRDAVLRYGLEHPVVNDKDFKVWKSYGARAWPTLVLLNPDGRVEGYVSGEGHYETLDQAIGLLAKGSNVNKQPMKFALERDKLQPCDLLFPGKVEAAEDRLFISDSNNHRILICTLDGEILDQIGSGKRGMDDGPFEKATLHQPQGIRYRDGKLYIADTENHLLRVADLKAREVKRLAGTGRIGYQRKGGKALETPLNSPWDLVWLEDTLIVAMAGRHQIWYLKGDVVDAYAGTGGENIDDGPFEKSTFSQPSGLTVLDGIIYVADSEDSGIRALDPRKRRVTTVVGKGLFEWGDKDGLGDEVRLQHPVAVHAVDDRIYIADTYNHKIKALFPKTRGVTTLAAGFNEPSGIAYANGKLYVADTNNHAIKVVDPKSGETTTLKLRKK